MEVGDKVIIEGTITNIERGAQAGDVITVQAGPRHYDYFHIYTSMVKEVVPKPWVPKAGDRVDYRWSATAGWQTNSREILWTNGKSYLLGPIDPQNSPALYSSEGFKAYCRKAT